MSTINKCLIVNWVFTGLLFSLTLTPLHSQMVIGEGTPDPSAMLDVKSTTKGVLVPRLTQSQRDAIVLPATGLMIFNTDVNGIQINIGTKYLPEWVDISTKNGEIDNFDCAGVSVSGYLNAGTFSNEVTIRVPYSGGNGGYYQEQHISSTGVSGLTANLSSGNLSNGNGFLNYTVTGMPLSDGRVIFNIGFGSQSCQIEIPVQKCGAFINPGIWKSFLCHNLGVFNTYADPFSPGWETNGGYWQWGRKILGASGPIGSSAQESNSGAINSWLKTSAETGSWKDTEKTANDPCPDGYRIPTKIQWEGLIANNTISNIGSWASGSMNYTNGKKIGKYLMLPAAGRRSDSDGELRDRGSFGLYWSSTSENSQTAWHLNINASSLSLNNNYVSTAGMSVRCIAEEPLVGTVGSILCGDYSMTGALFAEETTLGVRVSLPYSEGNGGTYNAMSISSTGISGLTANLTAGSFVTGTGVLEFEITGTPASQGTATFQVTVGDKICTFSLPVSGTCRAKISNSGYRRFMCHNLGSANTNADPFDPSWEITGGYWQWGQGNLAAQGPAGVTAAVANDGPVAGWRLNPAPSGSWVDFSKTSIDPCPSGFRVPTKSDWDAIISNNTRTTVGAWLNGATSYKSGTMFGQQLMLPSSGGRMASDGAIDDRGNTGQYWSSTESQNGAQLLYLDNSTSQGCIDKPRNAGASVRCIEYTGNITSIGCSSAVISGSVISGQTVSGVTVSIPYEGGNGGSFDGQIISSSGITGLVATLGAGSFKQGSGVIKFNITGIPSGTGLATFVINIGGKSCQFQINCGLPAGMITALKCEESQVNGSLVYGQTSSSVTFSLPYAGGDGGAYSTQNIGSTGVTGLTAKLDAGIFSNGSGILTYKISGVPKGSGTANFAVVIGGNVCNVEAEVAVPQASVISLDCSNYSLSGTLIENQTVSNTTLVVSYSGGNGGVFDGQSLPSSGVNGLTASLLPGKLVYGDGIITFTITGTPATGGTASFNVNIGGKTCVIGLKVIYLGRVTALDCNSSSISSPVYAGQSNSSINRELLYSGGNGGIYSAQTIKSIGVTGLTAYLSGGTLNVGNGSLSLSINGTPTVSGIASFMIEIGGEFCTLNMDVRYLCRAKVNASDFLNFMCHNLGAANSNANPFIPGWEIIGGYWQWGRATMAASGPSLSNPNSGSILGWVTTTAPDLALSDAGKTLNDPCPVGYKLPTKAQWNAVLSNNQVTNVGTWTSSTTHYLSGKKIGNELFLPSAGFRSTSNGSLSSRGSSGRYWASSVSSSSLAGHLNMTNTSATTSDIAKNNGFSVRCVEFSGAIGSIACGGANITGTIVSGQASSGISVTVPYSDGNGGTYSGQTVASVGVSGLTASISPGVFTYGTGNLIYTITGTPENAGLASFPVNIGGKQCSFNTVVQPPGQIGSLNCQFATVTGTIVSGQPANGASINVLYTGGNAGAYNGQSITSTGVTGLTASLSQGILSSGAGSLTFTLSGIPASAGVASFPVSIGGQNCELKVMVTQSGTISDLNCGNSIISASILNGQLVSNVTALVPYSGGNGGFYGSQSVTSTGITGLLATLNSGFLNTGNGNLIYTISGTPASSGTASFVLNIGGKTCTLSLNVQNLCRAKVNATDYLNFMCHNLGAANTSANPFSPTWEIVGGYWQWGRSGVAAPGPTASVANSGSITGWSSTNAPNGSLSDTKKTDKDPCPTGYRIPTKAQWDGIIANNIKSNVGTWTNSTTNYGSGKKIGNDLFLPAAGLRSTSNGTLSVRGSTGRYWSSTESSTTSAGYLNFTNSSVMSTANTTRNYGFSIRCVEFEGTVSTIVCNSAVITGGLLPGQSANGVSASVPYTGGNGGTYSGQTVISTGVTGLTATLSSGVFASGTGNLTYTITGTPSTSGIASFALSLGGKSCALDVNVALPSGVISTLECSGSMLTGSLMSGQSASGVSGSVPYTGGNGGTYSGQTVTSTGVTGLTATLSSGVFASGTGNLIYTITGTPATSGTASFALNIGGKSCTLDVSVALPSGVISTLDCSVATLTGSLVSGQPANGVSGSVPYTGGNGGTYSGQTVTSTGVTGLTATLSSGVFASGTGNLTYTITGTPSSSGTASFALNIGGKSCTLDVSVVLPPGTLSSLDCSGAMVTGSLVSGQSANGVSVSVPYSGGNGGTYSGQTVTSTGVIGLTATLSSGVFASGTGNLIYTITGTPATSGTTSFALNIGGKSCTLNVSVVLPLGTISTLECSGSMLTGSLMSGQSASGVSGSVPYTGGNGGTYSGQTVTSTGVTGLTATLSSGVFASGTGNLTYTITGTPSTSGTASFALNIGGKSCTLDVNVALPLGVISTLDCSVATLTGSLVSGQSANGVSASVSYIGGNGGTYSGQTVTSTGVTGLTATLSSGVFSNGTGNLTYTITGTPSTSGTASFALNIGGKSCTLDVNVALPSGVISTLDCSVATLTGSLVSGQSANGVSGSVPYTGGNGGTYSGQTVTSTGVTGLTATLSSGVFSNGSGNLNYTIMGTPSGSGIASFALNIGGKSCSLDISVTTVCRAKISATAYKNFMCHNLGAANTNADPFTPSWENNGGYWQWGRKEQAAAGPIGPNAGEANDGAVNGWNTTNAADGSWVDGSKTSNDPCPAGYRVPTKAQWAGVVANNKEKTKLGNFNSSPTNYGSGMKFGDQLMLPAAGYRHNTGLFGRGVYGYYWGSTEFDNNDAWFLSFNSTSGAYTNHGNGRDIGYSVRCVAEDGYISGISCSNSVVTGVLTVGRIATGITATISYSGGNGGQHYGQTVNSTGVTGLTATVAEGVFAIGSGELIYLITGTPNSTGMAYFALNIGDQTCTLTVNVSPVCRAKINATEYKNFLCHNLGSANTSADPFTPSWENNGGYWQWGRKGQAAAGPTGPNVGEANDGAVNGWNTIDVLGGSWVDGTKTSNDPCPPGYRVPTSAQWAGVFANNSKINVGTFNTSPTNYGAGIKFGDQLMLPAAGIRDSDDGALNNRGYGGFYWSSTEYGNNNAEFLYVFSSFAVISYFNRTGGLSVRCVAEEGSISGISCSNSVVTGVLTVGQAANGVTLTVSYSGGNGGQHYGQTVNSTGVTGLTATVAEGVFAIGSGEMIYLISGTPNSTGVANFAVNIGGQTCTLTVNISPVCRAKINASDYKNFMCHNLGSANNGADPFTPSWENNGGYWQWGRKEQAAAGPTGPNTGDTNDGVVNGWNTTNPADASWVDGSKTSNDPCPTGYRVPTIAQWTGIVAYNSKTYVGAFNPSPTNYGEGVKFGDQLMLPAAGFRGYDDGALYDRGSLGYYWGSTEFDDNAWFLGFSSSGISPYYSSTRTLGLSVRCVAEEGSISGISCSNSAVTGVLTVGQAANGVTLTVSYSGGNGGRHYGQTVISTGVTGLTATLAEGVFAIGSGELIYLITGTPNSTGVANFAVNIGGQTCTLTVNVSPLCRAKINATEYKNFMCHNLGSANTSSDPFTPSWENNGGYWQWGGKEQAASGPTGPNAGEANDGAVNGWNTTIAADGSWVDGSKTSIDPCPAGYRVPTKAQLDGVIANNPKINVGTFNTSPTNYGAGIKFGDQLMLPAAGYRGYGDGALGYRGYYGVYWSSTEYVNFDAWYLYFGSSSANTNNGNGSIDYYRNYGFSVRCVAE